MHATNNLRILDPTSVLIFVPICDSPAPPVQLYQARQREVRQEGRQITQGTFASRLTELKWFQICPFERDPFWKRMTCSHSLPLLLSCCVYSQLLMMTSASSQVRSLRSAPSWSASSSLWWLAQLCSKSSELQHVVHTQSKSSLSCSRMGGGVDQD